MVNFTCPILANSGELYPAPITGEAARNAIRCTTAPYKSLVDEKLGMKFVGFRVDRPNVRIAGHSAMVVYGIAEITVKREQLEWEAGR